MHYTTSIQNSLIKFGYEAFVAITFYFEFKGANQFV